MNNFKFRVWDTKLLKFIPWNCFIGFNNPEYIIQQWVGSKDASKVDIYVGDVVEVRTPMYQNSCTDVVYFAGGMYILRDSKYTFRCDIHPIKIIGNIFENPELIELHDLTID